MSEKKYELNNFSIGIDVSDNEDHYCLSIYEKENGKCYQFYDDQANLIQRILDGTSNDIICLQKRLKHLLKSKIISYFDEIDPKTKKYRYDISKFDSCYPLIYFARQYENTNPILNYFEFSKNYNKSHKGYLEMCNKSKAYDNLKIWLRERKNTQLKTIDMVRYKDFSLACLYEELKVIQELQDKIEKIEKGWIE